MTNGELFNAIAVGFHAMHSLIPVYHTSDIVDSTMTALSLQAGWVGYSLASLSSSSLGKTFWTRCSGPVTNDRVVFVITLNGEHGR